MLHISTKHFIKWIQSVQNGSIVLGIADIFIFPLPAHIFGRKHTEIVRGHKLNQS